jgi:AcrR family transcriptional regulator
VQRRESGTSRRRRDSVPARGGPRSRGRDTEAVLIESATRLFYEKGYNGTSITDLADALGLVNASVYYYVASKQELLLRVLQSGMEGFLTRLEEIAAGDGSSQEKVRLAIENHLEFVVNRRDAVAVFLRERRFLEPPLSEAYDDSVDRYDELFIELVEEGIAAGEFPAVDAHLVTRLILGAINWIVEWYDPRGRLSRAELTDTVTDMLVGRLLASPPR